MRIHRALACAFVVAGCGGGGNTADMNSSNPDMTTLPDLSITGPASPTDFDIGLSVAFCTFNTTCGFIGPSETAACVAAAPGNRTMYPPSYSLDDAVKAGRVKYDPAAAQACIDAWKKAGCSTDQQFVANDQCNNVYTPLVMVGGMCLANSECVGGFCMGSSDQGCAGTCAAWIAEGTTCDPNNDQCDASKDFCSSAATKCVPLIAAGGMCGDDAFCDSKSFCITDPQPGDAGMGDAAVAPPSTCRAPGKVGDLCQVFLFGNDSCSPELFCDDTQTNPVCAMQKGAGQACGSYAACQDGLDCVGLDYDQNTGMTILGKCGLFLDIGGTCDPSLFETGCALDQSCDMGTKKCIVNGGLSSDCSDNGSGGYCRENLYCDVNSKCSQTTPFGAACVPPAMQGDPDPCQQGACDATAKTCSLQCM